jgi:ubiquinone biosynthesis protein UbiJ
MQEEVKLSSWLGEIRAKLVVTVIQITAQITHNLKHSITDVLDTLRGINGFS